MGSPRFTVTGLLFATAALVACGAPGSFDGLTGGDGSPPVSSSDVESAAYDPTLAAPRPIAPISVSFVATTKPRLRWDLPDTELGARVELCPTRACDKDVKSYDVDGRELVVKDDLAPGIWFWRLLGRAAGRVGTVPSPTWEFVVRPAAAGTSEAPSGSLFDFDGDGRPDLAVTTSEAMIDADTKEEVDVATVLVLFGREDGSFADDGRDSTYLFGGSIDDPLTGGTDVDGDGLPELAFAGLDPYGVDVTSLVLYHGDAKPTADALFKSTPLYAPVRGTTFAVSAAGDTDGDGFGDIALASIDGSLLARGTRDGLGAVQHLVLERTPVTTAAVGAGFDADGDGFADVAVTPPLADVPVGIIPGARGALAEPANIVPTSGGKPSRATAFAAGDFDGDALGDVAFATVLGAVPSVCVSLGDKERMTKSVTCTVVPGSVTALGAADLEGDGKDELLIGTATEGRHDVASARLGDGGLVIDQPSLAAGFGKSLTVLWPGRPGKARFAAVHGDGRSIAIIEGTTIQQRIGLSPWLSEFKHLR